MEKRHRILLLDDDPDLLDMYKEILGQLPSHPEIRTTTSGPRAMALLESQPFRLLICDLKMPKMDGLQVLSIVRRKHPQLRTVVLTSVNDEQFRSRVYALGVDLFWQKPGTEEEIRMFLECLESLLGREEELGFRGVQSKSLVDLIQLECLSQSSAVLRITNGTLSGKIWINQGEVVDAETDGLTGEPAFKRILSWRAGNFETLPAEPDRSRAIEKSYNALLLESAQALDESRSIGETASAAQGPALAPLAAVEGVDFVLALKSGETPQFDSCGLENPDQMANWARQSCARLRALSDKLQVGTLERFAATGPQRNVTLASRNETDFCIGWQPATSTEQMWEGTKKALALWAL
jgi:CheY-like chemotaxis protein